MIGARKVATVLLLGVVGHALSGCGSSCRPHSRTWRSGLASPTGSPQPRASGKIRAREVRCGNGSGSRLSVRVRRANPAEPLEVFLYREDGSFSSLGTVSPNAHGHGKLKASASVDATDWIVVRDVGGAVVLEGQAPATRWEKTVADLLVESAAAESPEGLTTAAADYELDPASGRERLWIEFGGLPADAWLDLRLDGEGEEAGLPILARRAGPDGTVRARFDTVGGPGLPGGARRVRDLWHRRLRLQVDGDGVYDGPLPAVGARAAPLPRAGER